MDNNNKNSNSNQSQNRGGYQRPGGFQNRPRFNSGRPQDSSDSEYFEKVVQVNRVSKKTKGGNKRGLSVIVVAGDKKGRVGVGLGKASDVQSAVRKASAYAKKHMIEVPLKDGRTIPHSVYIKLGAAKVLLKGAPEGTGVIAGGAVRVVVEAAGIRDIVSKTLGTKNQASNVYATLQALTKLKPVVQLKTVKKSEASTKDKKDAK
jgi:small subunit ribosomal protein S5